MNFWMKERVFGGLSAHMTVTADLMGSYSPWSPDKGSSSCLPKEARIEYERQEKSVAGNSSYLLA